MLFFCFLFFDFFNIQRKLMIEPKKCNANKKNEKNKNAEKKMTEVEDRILKKKNTNKKDKRENALNRVRIDRSAWCTSLPFSNDDVIETRIFAKCYSFTEAISSCELNERILEKDSFDPSFTTCSSSVILDHFLFDNSFIQLSYFFFLYITCIFFSFF